MSQITTLFFDIGGVCLSNGWDHFSRKLACEKFDLDLDDFERRHSSLSHDLETAKIDLQTYLNETVFHCSRQFPQEDFIDFIHEQSMPYDDVLADLALLAYEGKYRLYTINNESAELNLFRVQKFQLNKYFSAFFTSCYLGITKPHKDIYEKALYITQRVPEECLFIDDRPENLAPARLLGMNTIQFQSRVQLHVELNQHGICENWNSKPVHLDASI